MKQLTAQEMIDLPFFFIIGRPRTGTTLLRSLMDAHPNVIIPLEGPFILQLYGKYHKVTNWTEEIILEFYDDLMIKNSMEFLTVDNWKLDKEKLKNDLLSCQGPNTFANICKVINGNYPPAIEKDPIALGDKNPVYSNKVKYIRRLYPDAKFVIITRDYRDHIQSMHRVDFGQVISPVLAYRWRKYIRTNSRLMRKYPEQFYWIKYEDFAAEPKKYLKEITEFVGIPFEEKVLEFYKYKELADQRGYKELQEKYHKSLLKPITTKSVGEWKKNLRDIDVRMADAMVGKYAEKAGYERKYKSCSLGMRLKLIPVFIYLIVTDSIATVFLKQLSPQRNSKIVARGPRLLMKYWKYAHKDETVKNPK